MKTVSLRMPRAASPAQADPPLAPPVRISPTTPAASSLIADALSASEFVAGFILGVAILVVFVVLPCIQRHPCCRGEAMATAIVILLHVVAVEIAIVAIHHYLRTGRFGPKE